MKNTLTILWYFSLYSMKGTFSQPIGVVFFTLGKLFRFGIFFVFIYFLVSNTKLLAGYNLNQSIVFYLTYNLIDTITQFLFREVYRFRQLVVSGELDGVLIKPYNPFLKVLFGGIDTLDLILIFPYAGLLIFFVAHNPGLTVTHIFSYIILLINAMIIATAFHIFVLALGILTTDVDHTVMIYRDISKLGLFPIDIYSEPIRSLLSFVVPIGIMLTFPTKALFGLLSLPVILISIAISCILFYASLWSWNQALKKYQSWGG